ncbi:tetratricopeptide repeat protein [Roseomonas sp. AR75]|uniref:tetratricopeptide repeat protein n=1 Tax=Roseomonas sp. AR75 TaxID=2562311 RepID=UPI0010BF95AF|nr:tetratricopeptide repeat protein [Roseomonas sp. AR75]
MPDIFDEVEEDLRAERARKLAQRWGGVALGVVLAALAATGAWQGWRWYEARQAAAAAETYLSLHRASEREGADLAAAGNGFAALARESPSGYQTLARLRAAALKAETGDLPGAIALWDQVAADTGADPLYRDLATLLAVSHGIDSADPALLAARIAPLTGAGNPWRSSALEAQALIAVRRGQTAEAKRILDGLVADQSAPAGVRERAQRVAAGLRT